MLVCEMLLSEMLREMIDLWTYIPLSNISSPLSPIQIPLKSSIASNGFDATMNSIASKPSSQILFFYIEFTFPIKKVAIDLLSPTDVSKCMRPALLISFDLKSTWTRDVATFKIPESFLAPSSPILLLFNSRKLGELPFDFFMTFASTPIEWGPKPISFRIIFQVLMLFLFPSTNQNCCSMFNLIFKSSHLAT